jgi:hypothetical protein
VSPVLDIKRTSSNPLKPLQEDLLYRRGKMTSSCTLILNGTVALLSGKARVRVRVRVVLLSGMARAANP